MIEKIAGEYGVNPLAQTKSKKIAGTGASKADAAEFSSFAVELARYTEEAAKTPEVRQELVEAMKKKLAAGAYAPPLEKAAYNLFMAGITNDSGDKD